ncbi:cation ABC superfamily ATP binding cassette transporter, ABC protein [Bordetella holmesii 35009]|nr:cation ABC superfamily ATP binding cassette transporter, ABC protein [Bordetella holmesii 35009]
MFARLLMQDAPILVLDEPFAAVDGQTTRVIMALLCALNAEGRSVIAVLHDMALVKEYFTQTLLLSGRVLDWAPRPRCWRPSALRTVNCIWGIHESVASAGRAVL